MSARWFSTAASRWRSPIRRQASIGVDRPSRARRRRRPPAASARASAVSAAIDAVGSGSSAASATLRSSAARGRRRDRPVPARPARPAARPRRRGADRRAGRATSRASAPRPRRRPSSPARSATTLARPGPVPGVASARSGAGAGRDPRWLAAAARSPRRRWTRPRATSIAGRSDGSASAAAVSSAAMAAGYSPRRDRSSPIRACAPAASAGARARRTRWSIASRLANTASARSAASRNAAAASAGRPASRSWPAMSANRVRSSRSGRRPVQPERVGGAPVEQPAAGEARRLVGHVAHPAVREVVPDGRAAAAGHLADEAAAHELLDRVDRLLLRPAAGLADDREVERPTDDRRRRQDLGRPSR